MRFDCGGSRSEESSYWSFQSVSGSYAWFRELPRLGVQPVNRLLRADHDVVLINLVERVLQMFLDIVETDEHQGKKHEYDGGPRV